ncbi:MAG: class I SAM-dependent methyltransferase [Candidatus Binataceae bacterium]
MTARAAKRSLQILGSTARDTGSAARYVPESRFGVWFLGTAIWTDYVLQPALEELDGLIQNRRASYPVIVDVGCGSGHSFKLLNERFWPVRMVGIDVDPQMLARASVETNRHKLAVEFQRASSSALPLSDQSVDLLFCHQTFHHLRDQRDTLREFHRVLKHEGVLLFAESTRKYIRSWIVRLLFRHPMEVQRSAPEYLAMIRDAGFKIHARAVSYPYLWWSRSDFAIMERWFGLAPPANREATLINLVAIRV